MDLTLEILQKTARCNFLFLENFDKQDKMQLLAKFKNILYMGFRATLNFPKFKVALNVIPTLSFSFSRVRNKSSLTGCFLS